MKITKLAKTANINDNTCKLSVEITIEPNDFECFDYQGLDMIPDRLIPDILMAIGKMYVGKIKDGKVVK